MLNESVLRALLLLSGIGISAAASIVLTRYVKQFALRRQLLDQPNHRSMHQMPTPRLGGIAIVFAFFVGMAYFAVLERLVPSLAGFIQFPRPEIFIGAALIALTGLYDDLKGLSAKAKLYAQCVVALMVIMAGFRFNLPFLPLDKFGLFGEAVTIGLTFLWIVGVINALNLLDGLDGLAAGVSIIVIGSLTLAIAVNGYGPDIVFVAAFIGAIAGFLVYNSHPASIFMGDTGSLFLGFMLATFALPITGEPNMSLAFLIPVLALGLPIADTLTAIVRRALTRKGLFSPDREHFHHRISTRLGYSHRATVFAMYAISLAFGLASVFIAVSNDYPAMALGLAMFSGMIIFLLLKLEYIRPSRGKRSR